MAVAARIFIVFSAAVLVGCSSPSGSNNLFSKTCYSNVASGQRLLCIAGDGYYKIFFDQAIERGQWVASGGVITLTRDVYETAHDPAPTAPPNSPPYSCTFTSDTSLHLTCSGSSITKNSITTTLTPDGQELVFAPY